MYFAAVYFVRVLQYLKAAGLCIFARIL
uniref:Uncharacterized protein n=1 Tax=Anguilla anguilla TaxID=7936 RepID=A0A0E9VIY5_ANGAN